MGHPLGSGLTFRLSLVFFGDDIFAEHALARADEHRRRGYTLREVFGDALHIFTFEEKGCSNH